MKNEIEKELQKIEEQREADARRSKKRALLLELLRSYGVTLPEKLPLKIGRKRYVLNIYALQRGLNIIFNTASMYVAKTGAKEEKLLDMLLAGKEGGLSMVPEEGALSYVGD